jgi:hypothetical protein
LVKSAAEFDGTVKASTQAERQIQECMVVWWVRMATQGVPALNNAAGGCSWQTASKTPLLLIHWPGNHTKIKARLRACKQQALATPNPSAAAYLLLAVSNARYIPPLAP